MQIRNLPIQKIEPNPKKFPTKHPKSIQYPSNHPPVRTNKQRLLTKTNPLQNQTPKTSKQTS